MQMGIGSMTVTVKIKNMEKFIELSEEFRKKPASLKN
nr:MAG TPA: dUTPase [Caudoviricetes sp.]